MTITPRLVTPVLLLVSAPAFAVVAVIPSEPSTLTLIGATAAAGVLIEWKRKKRKK